MQVACVVIMSDDGYEWGTWKMHVKVLVNPYITIAFWHRDPVQALEFYRQSRSVQLEKGRHIKPLVYVHSRYGCIKWIRFRYLYLFVAWKPYERAKVEIGIQRCCCFDGATQERQPAKCNFFSAALFRSNWNWLDLLAGWLQRSRHEGIGVEWSGGYRRPKLWWSGDFICCGLDGIKWGKWKVVRLSSILVSVALLL